MEDAGLVHWRCKECIYVGSCPGGRLHSVICVNLQTYKLYVIGTCKLYDIGILNCCMTLNYYTTLKYCVTLNYDKTCYNKPIEDSQQDSVYFIMVNSAKIQEPRTVSFVTTQQEEVLTINF